MISQRLEAESQAGENVPETEQLGYYLFDKEAPPERLRAVIIDYFHRPYADFQIQSKVEAMTAADDYQKLIADLSAHEGEMACLFRTGYHGETNNDGPWGNSSAYRPMEDLTVFEIRKPMLAVAKIPDEVNLNNRQGSGHIDGIILLQPLIGYGRRRNDLGVRDWSVYSESNSFPGPNEENRFDPFCKEQFGKIFLSWVDLYNWSTHPLPGPRGLEYAARDTHIPSIAYSPTRYDQHMRLIIGNEPVIGAIQKVDIVPLAGSRLADALQR